MRGEDRVAAIVVAYNGGDELLACVASLLGQTIDDLEVVIVDNASGDDSIERLETEADPRVRIIRGQTNGGYAAGANIGWRATDAPIIAILNQDLILAPDCLGQMRSALQSVDVEALVTPKLVLRANEGLINAVGNEVSVSGISWCRGLGTSADDWRGVQEVTAVSGAAFMATRRLLDELGGLEEAYFMYLEDVDLSLRARLAGAVCLAACDAVASHDWALALSPAKFEQLERNRRALWGRFIGPGDGRWLVLVQAEAMAWTYAAMRGRAHLRAKWRARVKPLVVAGLSMDRTPALTWLRHGHPYDVLFPSSRIVIEAGRVADLVVAQGVSVWCRVARPVRALSHRMANLRFGL